MRYTPYSLPKNATASEIASHAKERAFYDMTGETNIFSYITTAKKLTGAFTFFEYLQKNTGVFNDTGILSQEEIAAMKQRLKDNKGNIWHGFISLSKEDSPKINTPEKCIELVKRTFPSFFDDARIGRKNVDLMCALHLDRPDHLHIHFVAWEKEPKYMGDDGKKHYRRKGRIERQAIDNMFVRLGLFIDEDKEKLHLARDEAMKELRAITRVKEAMSSTEEIRAELLALAKDLPAEKHIYYGTKEAEPFRARVDKIVGLMLAYDRTARRADKRFYDAVAERERKISNICGQPYAFSDSETTAAEIEKDMPKYHHKIDPANIKIIDEIEADYRRRQGNLILNVAQYIKPEMYERKKGKKYRTNDRALKRQLGMSQSKIDQRIRRFFSTFGTKSELLERDCSHRLQDIEEEIERERKKEKEKNNKAE